jgi:hypothetical protein
MLATPIPAALLGATPIMVSDRARDSPCWTRSGSRLLSQSCWRKNRMFKPSLRKSALWSARGPPFLCALAQVLITGDMSRFPRLLPWMRLQFTLEPICRMQPFAHLRHVFPYCSAD